MLPRTPCKRLWRQATGCAIRTKPKLFWVLRWKVRLPLFFTTSRITFEKRVPERLSGFVQYDGCLTWWMAKEPELLDKLWGNQPSSAAFANSQERTVTILARSQIFLVRNALQQLAVVLGKLYSLELSHQWFRSRHDPRFKPGMGSNSRNITLFILKSPGARAATASLDTFQATSEGQASRSGRTFLSRRLVV